MSPHHSSEPCAQSDNFKPLYRNSRLYPVTLKNSCLLGNPLIARYVASLIARPLLTKCCTSGILSFFQEVVANHIAGVKIHTAKDAGFVARFLAALKIDSKAFKMALYGFFVSAPMGHYLTTLMLRIFAGRTSKKAKFGQLVVQNFVIAPIHVFVYLASMAVIRGARSSNDISVGVHRGFGKMLGLTWILNPTAMLVAKKTLPTELWSLFFSLVNFTIGTYFNTKVKRFEVRLALAEKKRWDASEKRKGDDCHDKNCKDCGSKKCDNCDREAGHPPDVAPLVDVEPVGRAYGGPIYGDNSIYAGVGQSGYVSVNQTSSSRDD